MKGANEVGISARQYELEVVARTFMEVAFKDGVLPFLILRMAVQNFPQFTKLEIQRELSDILFFNKSFDICMERGHMVVKAEAEIEPESATEYLHCGRCGVVEKIYWY